MLLNPVSDSLLPHCQPSHNLSPFRRQTLFFLFHTHSCSRLKSTLLFLTSVGPCTRRGERSLRPAENTVGARPKQFIYLVDWLDPFLQTADCLFEGKPKVLFCAPEDPPFPPHQWGVKVLGTQCLQVCFTNPDFDKVLVKKGAL